MRRKIKDSVIDTLATVLFCFLFLSCPISFVIFLWYAPGDVSPYITGIAFIYFLISLIGSAFCNIDGLLNFLRKRNGKIDEEEKAQLQAKAQAEAERTRIESQIWVSE